jgi:hypothetical protein
VASPQRAYSFFFTESTAETADPPEETLFRAVLASDDQRQARFELRQGGLLLDTLAYRSATISVDPSPPGKRYGTSTVIERGDKELYRTLIYDFCDAIKWDWHTKARPHPDLP